MGAQLGADVTRRLDPDELAAVEEERAFVVRSLDDLDRERAAGDLDPADHASLRDDYQRRLDLLDRSIAEGRAAFADARVSWSWTRRLVVTGLVVATAAGAGLGVAQASGTRQAGQEVTGDVRQTSAGKLSEAAQLADEGRYSEALEVYDEIIDADPDNAAALADRGLLMVTLAEGAGVGDGTTLAETGRASLERALELDPGNARYLFYRGLVRRLGGDLDGARAAYLEALAQDPSPDLRSQIESYLEALDTTTTTLG